MRPPRDRENPVIFQRAEVAVGLRPLPLIPMDAQVRFTIPISDPAPWPTVLVLAQDAEWRGAVARGLEREGFEVLTARHAGHALLVCRRFAKPVDLLIADAVS